MNILFFLSITIPFLFFSFSDICARDKQSFASGVTLTGEQKAWHKLTLEIEGPSSSEQGGVNPFLDYRLDVAFRQGEKTYVVPGYYAADGQAGHSSASNGNIWKAHFTPDATGAWEYEISFRKGSGIAVSGAPGSALPFDGTRGSFTVGASDKKLPDNRARGRLQYVGGHYLRYAQSGKYFLKGGADAPENFLAYADFDGTQNNDGISDELIKSWSAHQQDWRIGDPTWQGEKGKGMIGAINYLASEGLNVFSFLTMNILGDDKNVFPYIKYNGNLSSTPVDDRLRFDVSKLDQWEMVFEHAETLGMFLHVKLQETEVDELLDGGKLGVERKLYYREMIARFGHHLALNWNLGEEHQLWAKLDDADNEYLRQYAEYFHQYDPYHHHLVVHTHTEKKEKIYPYLLGNQSKLTGFSLQSHYGAVHADTKYWLSESVKAGQPWVAANDEQGPANNGVLPDGGSNNHNAIRKNVMWGNLMAGGSGCEFYFGYDYDQSDLDCEDWRSRDAFWDYVRHALHFFREYVPYWEMKSTDELVGNTTNTNDKYCLAKTGEVYVVYLANGGSTHIDLSSGSGTYTVKWYNPRKGGGLVEGSVKKISGNGGVIGHPPVEEDEDWVALLERSGEVSMKIDKFVLYDTESNSIIADPLEDGAEIQASDKVSLVAVSAPSVIGSVAFTVNGEQGHISDEPPYAIAGHSSGGIEADAFVEQDGMVLWEAERVAPQGAWQLQTKIADYSGSGYYTWTGNDYFNTPGKGTIRYVVKISKAGNYEFVFRTKNTLEQDKTEHNDSWVRIPTGKNVSGEEPLNGEWTKVYQSQPEKWSWQARTVDHENLPIRVYLEEGTHEVLLAGRSHGHGIDRMALYKYDEVSFGEKKFDALPNSEQISGERQLQAWPLVGGTHTITATPFADSNAKGIKGKDLTITLTVVDESETNMPAAPTELQGLSEVEKVSLSWKDNTDNEDGFEIERKEGDGNYRLIHVVKANAASYADETPEKGKEYYYRVRAVNTFGKSGYSNEIKIAVAEPINNLPTAIFTVDNKSGSLPLKVEFDASDASDADGKIVAYHWDFADGNQGTGEVTTHTFETEGIYNVRLTVIDDRNGEATIIQKIIVLSPEEIQGKTYYVSSSEGNDNNKGTSVGQPWKTLQKVNGTQFSPGDSILFKRGDTWSENLTVPTSGMANGYIHFATYGQGEQPVFAPVNAAEAVNIEGKSYISVSEIHVIAEAYEKGIRIAGNAAYVIIDSCMVEGHSSNTSTRGIEYSALSHGEYPTYPTITDCEVYNFKEGIGGYAGLHEGGNISSNFVHTTATEGTDLIRAISGDYEGLKVSNNELTGWKDDAIDIYGGSNVIVEYNHVYSPAHVLSENGSGSGIKAGGVGPPQSIGNIIRYNKIHHLGSASEAAYDGINTNSGSNGKIYGNLIYAVLGHAIAIASGHDFWRIYHNSLISAKKSSISIGDNVKNIELINNIIGGKTYDIEVNGTNAIVSGYYNLLINEQNQENPVGGDGVYHSETDINYATTNGLLFNNTEKEDFRLAENGAAIDAGMTLENYKHDIQGESIEHLPDIGAYEYQQADIVVLGPPFNLQANEILGEEVELIWSDVNQDVWFVIERVTVSESDFIVIDTTSSKSYIDTNVQHGIKYFYRVKAMNSLAASDYSSIIDIKLENPEKDDNLPPVASFTTDVNEGKAPLEVSFDASGAKDQDGDIIAYHWDFGDGIRGSGKQITHVFAAAGEYTILLTVTDDQDSTAKVSQVINVILPENQLPIADAGEDKIIASPTHETKLYGGGTDPDGELISYVWKQFSGPNQATIVDPASPTTQISELIVGEYLFQLTVTDDRGGRATDEVSVFVEGIVWKNQLPIAFAGEDRTVTLPADTIILTGIGTDHDGTIATYHWSYVGVDNIQVGNENESTITVSGLTIGVHQFQFTVTDNDGGTATDAVEVMVKGSLEIIRANKAFSPNGDGIDDLWIIENVEAIEECELTIYNRAGQQVFEATPYHNNWDATINGQPLPNTDYYYIIRCDSEKMKSGGIRVFR